VALAAALPLGFAAWFLARERRRAAELEDWWQHREHVRSNGRHGDPARVIRRDDLFV
jgi:hypothetical protein